MIVEEQKQKIAARHSKKVIKREFKVGDLVLRRNQKDLEEGKLAANWEGPYRVRMKTGMGAYRQRRSPQRHHPKNLECRETQKVLHLDGKPGQQTLMYILSSKQ